MNEREAKAKVHKMWPGKSAHPPVGFIIDGGALFVTLLGTPAVLSLHNQKDRDKLRMMLDVADGITGR